MQSSTVALLDGAPDRPAIAWRDTVLDRRTLRARIDQLAVTLEGAGGQRVAIVAPNVPALVVGLFAVWRVGAVAVPLSGRLRRYELQRIFTDVQPWAAVSIGSHGGFPIAETIRELAPTVPTLAVHVVLDEVGRLSTVWARAARAKAPSLGEDAATILYTSGTTGEPKGAVERHAKELAVAHSFAEVLGLHAEEPCGLVVPVTHCFGLGCLLASVGAGALAVLVDSTASNDPLLEAVKAHRVGVLHGPPALFARLLQTTDRVPAWRTGFVAGARCPPDLLSRLEQRGTQMLGQYGLTEVGSVTACRTDDPHEIRYHTVGRALDGYQVRAVPAPGAPDDEIQIRSAFIWPGLVSRPWDSDEMTSDGWLRTGDLGSVDDKGHVVIAGRAKEVVQTGGFNVYPAEVEGFLNTYPGISSAAVLGVSHATLGETLAAFVVPTPGTSFDRRAFIAFCRAGIAGYKVPSEIQVIDEMPQLASGKPDRRTLAGRLDHASREIVER